MKSIIKYLLILYRKLRPFSVGCRYYPSCSHYTEQAIEKHGVVYGGLLSLKRLFRCNQWFQGGFDPVP